MGTGFEVRSTEDVGSAFNCQEWLDGLNLQGFCGGFDTAAYWENVMQGAKEFASLFETGQHGQLYLVSGEHARGKTFRIFVLPESERVMHNGKHNPPLNKDAVEVYGILGGQPGWTEYYGWMRAGKWQQDFERLVEDRKAEMERQAEEFHAKELEKRIANDARESALLASY